MDPPDKDTVTKSLPLTVPLELWSGFDHEERQLYRNAQRLLDSLQAQTDFPSDYPPGSELDDVDDMDPAEVVNALGLLQSMDLVTIDAEGDELELTLIALPDEHIKVDGPNGSPQWVFVAKPLYPPAPEPQELN